MKRIHGWIWIGLLIFNALFFSGETNAAPSKEAPSQNSAFVLLDSSPELVRILYRNPAQDKSTRIDSSIYVGIPVGATYDLAFRSWGYRAIGSNSNPSPTLRSEALNDTELLQLKKNLNSIVTVRRSEFQELDVLKLQINSLAKITGSNKLEYSLVDLEFEIRWTPGVAPKPEMVSELDAGFRRLFSDLCINGKDIPSLRRKRILPENEKTLGFHPAIVGYKETGNLVNLSHGLTASRADGVRVSIRENGMVAVRASDFTQQGIVPDLVDLNQLRVWHRGIEQPVAIDENGDGIFGEGDAIIFYGQESDSEYTQYSQYFLTWNEFQTPPKRIERGVMNWVDDASPYFLANRRYAKDRILVEEKTDVHYSWCFLEMDKKSKDLLLDLPELVLDDDVQVTLNTFNKSRSLKGFTAQIGNATTHFAISDRINSVTTFIFSVTAAEFVLSPTLTITLDEEPEVYSPLKEGLSEKVGNVPHLFFDSIEILYPRKAVLDRQGFVMERAYMQSSTQAIVFSATGTSESFSAWVKNVSGDVVRWSADALPARPGFRLPEGDWQWIEVKRDSSLPGPYTLDRDFPSTLHRKDQGFNYIIVSPYFMATKAGELARRREKEGFSVLLVDVQDIYDEFNDGYPECVAIKNFFRYAQSEWTGLSPEFVLLIGDCSWDHCDRLEYGALDLVPTYAPVDNPMADASDEWYAFLWGGGNDYFSDLIMGRISVQSIDDLGKYLTKIDAYENTAVGPWRARGTYITDDDDGTFERFAISNSQKSLPETYFPHFIHQGHFPLVTNPYLYHKFFESKIPGSEKFLNKKYCPECVKAILREFDEGSVLMQYIGHGGNQLWSEERIFYGTDRNTSNVLELQPNTRFPFVVSWSCLTGYLNFNIQPWTVCLSEELIRYPDRGAIAVWGPSGGGTTNKHMSLSKYMLRNLTLDGLDRLGEATTLTKIEFMQEESSPSLINQYILFGDPAVRLSLPQERNPVSVTPGFILSGKQQTFDFQTTTNQFQEGQAIVSMTIAGDHIYQSTPFEFTNGQIQRRFTVALDTITESTAVVRFYAWNEKENRDAWGGMPIPQKTISLEVKNGTASWNGSEATIRFELLNSSPFPVSSVRCEINLGDRIESAIARDVAAFATSPVEWKGTVSSSTPCAYVSVPNDSEQGIKASADTKTLLIPFQPPTSNPMVPLLGMMTFSAKDMVVGKTTRLQIPVQNFSPDQTAFSSWVMDGPGAATDVKDVTLTAGKDRRLDFTVTLPEAGEREYSLKQRSGDMEQTFKVPVTVRGKPDLALAEGDFTYEPLQPVVGKTVYLHTTVYNVGDGPATDVLIKAFDGDPSLKRELRPYNSSRSTTIEQLNPGEMKTITLTWDPISYEGLGTHEIHFVIDPQNRIDELSELNNRSSGVLVLNDLPDLTVEKWTGHGFRAELKGGMPIWGQPLQLLARIANNGDSDAEYVRLTLKHNRKDVTKYYDLIPKGTSEETYIEVPLYASKNTLRLVADEFDLVAEKNEKENSIDRGNNVSEEQRIDFKLTMPTAPLAGGRRIYRVTDENSFSAGSGEYLIYDTKHHEMVMHPNLETVKYRIVPSYVQEVNSYSLTPNNQLWHWSSKYTCFYTPLEKDVPLRLTLPAPNGIYDVYLHLYSSAYAKGKTEKIRIKTPQDTDFRIIEHGEVETKNYLRKICENYHIRDDQFLMELRPVLGGISTTIADIQFVRPQTDLPISSGYLSPYFPAPGSGSGAATLLWNAEIPEGTAMQVKARWVMRLKDGNFKFFPWAKIAEGQDEKIELAGQGDYFQYYVNFIRMTHDSVTPKLRNVSLSIPCREESSEIKESPTR